MCVARTGAPSTTLRRAVGIICVCELSQPSQRASAHWARVRDAISSTHPQVLPSTPEHLQPTWTLGEAVDVAWGMR